MTADSAAHGAADVLAPAPAATPSLPGTGPVYVYASWAQRVVATLLDNGVLAAVGWLAVDPGFPLLSLAPVFGVQQDQAAPPGPGQVWAFAAFAVLVALQAWSGFTPGKLVVGIAVVHEDSGRPAGLGRTLLRLLAHFLDAFLILGYLRPLWDRRRQTIADSLVGTVVVWRTPALPVVWRRVVGCAALVVCVLGLGFGCVPVSGSGYASGGTTSCDPVTGDAIETSHSVEITESTSSSWERRLWVRREQAAALHLLVDWSWATPPGAAPAAGYELRLAVAGHDGEAVPHSPWSQVLNGSTDGSAYGGAMTGSDDGKAAPRYEVTESPDGDVHTAAFEVRQIPVPDGAEQVTVTARLLATEEWGPHEVATCTATLSLTDNS